MWFGIMFLISVASWEFMKNGRTHSSEEYVTIIFCKKVIEDKLNDERGYNEYVSQ